MKKFLFILSAAFAVLAVSCEKSTKITEPEEQAEKYSRTFTCVFAAPESVDPDSKVSIASDGKVAWEVGDEIMIHGGNDGADRKLVTLTAEDISADGKHATFTIEGLAPYDRTPSVVSLYYAQYPASAVPTGNMYYECAFNNTNAMLMAACNEGDTFRFFNLCGVISYVVSGDFDSVVFSGNNAEEVTFTDYYQVRVRDDGAGATCNYFKPGNGFKTNTPGTSISTSVVSDGTTVNYIYLPRGVNFTGGFIFKFVKGGEIVKTVSTSTPVNVDHGKLLPLGDITSHLITYVAPSSHDAEHPAIAGAEDLGSVETANCYIIDGSNAANADKVFKFKAVRGNGTVPAGAISSVEVLWETWNNAETVTAKSVVAEADFDKQDGDDDYWITFKMPATLHAGNAVIAAKNSGGSILWSWHIWVQSTTVTSNTYGIYSSALMDRNLGALVAATTSSVPVESFGLHYEWGRKDPFVGARGIADNSFAKVSGTAISVGYEMTLAQTIANPTQYAVYTSADSWGNWLTPYDNTLWQDDTKTIYDPCPVGYKVPKYESSQPWHSSDLSKVTGWSDVAAAGDNAPYFTIGSPVAVFPYCGLVCENGEYMDYPGERSFTWMAHCSSSSGSGYIMDVRFNTSTHKQTSTVTARGCSVRCVAE